MGNVALRKNTFPLRRRRWDAYSLELARFSMPSIAEIVMKHALKLSAAGVS